MLPRCPHCGRRFCSHGAWLIFALLVLGCEPPKLGVGADLLTCGLIEVEGSPFQNESEDCVLFLTPGFYATEGLDDACSSKLETCILLQPGEWVRKWVEIHETGTTAKHWLKKVDCSETCGP